MLFAVIERVELGFYRVISGSYHDVDDFVSVQVCGLDLHPLERIREPEDTVAHPNYVQDVDHAVKVHVTEEEVEIRERGAIDGAGDTLKIQKKKRIHTCVDVIADLATNSCY